MILLREIPYKGNRGRRWSVISNMRLPFVWLLAGAAATAQPFTAGVKGGVPLSDFLNTVETQRFRFDQTTNRYIIGATAELRLPFGLGIEVDALYRHFSYQGSVALIDVLTSSSASGNAWEFPVLVKYRFPARIVRPYVDAGVAWDTLSGLEQTITTTVFPSRTTTISTSNPAELHKNTTTGFVMGVGLDAHVVMHISPEIRYTRWGTQHFLDPNGGLQSNQNQAEFLVGITF